LSPAAAAVLMSLSTIVVALNAQLLRRLTCTPSPKLPIRLRGRQPRWALPLQAGVRRFVSAVGPSPSERLTRAGVRRPWKAECRRRRGRAGITRQLARWNVGAKVAGGCALSNEGLEEVGEVVPRLRHMVTAASPCSETSAAPALRCAWIVSFHSFGILQIAPPSSKPVGSGSRPSPVRPVPRAGALVWPTG
jgi:hypothetical protein